MTDRKAFHVRFLKEERVTSRYGMVIFAEDQEAAKARLEAGFKGELDLTDEELRTEQHEKEYDSDGTDFIKVCDDPWDAPTEVDPEDWDIDA